MGIPDISTEALQVFTANEAFYWELVPWRIENGHIDCLGKTGHDYTEAESEIFAIYGYHTRIMTIDDADFTRLISSHYREETADRLQALDGSDSDIVGKLINEAYSMQASDVHLEPAEEKCRVRYRTDGKLIETHIIHKDDYLGLVNRLKIMANLDISEKRLPQDGRIMYTAGEIRFDIRMSVLPTIHGEKTVLRLLAKNGKNLSLQELGLDGKQYGDYLNAIMKPHGLILISGPTGSGKSTTLYATLERLNRGDNNILTIEDPVEYTIDGVNQVQLKEDIGLDFPMALRTFLRQDPDIIMLGEIRDEDTAEMAIRSSLTGHLLLSTLHTNSAWGCIDRLADMGIHRYLISETLLVCVAQRLVRLLCPSCKRPEDIPERLASLSDVGQKQKVYARNGCPECHYTGYKGRKAIYEVIPVDDTLSNAIREGQQDIRNYLSEKNIKTLRESAVSLYLDGLTSLEEIFPLLD